MNNEAWQRVVAAYEFLIEACCAYVESEDHQLPTLLVCLWALAEVAKNYKQNPEAGPRIELSRLERLYELEPYNIPELGRSLFIVAMACAADHPPSLDFAFGVVQRLARKFGPGSVGLESDAEHMAIRLYYHRRVDPESELYRAQMTITEKWREEGSWWTHDIATKLRDHLRDVSSYYKEWAASQKNDG